MGDYVRHEIEEALGDTVNQHVYERERFARDSKLRNDSMREKRIKKIREEDMMRQMLHRNDFPAEISEDKMLPKPYGCLIPESQAQMEKFQAERLRPVPIQTDAIDRLMQRIIT